MCPRDCMTVKALKLHRLSEEEGAAAMHVPGTA